ncbi:hypothetical protein [Phenylobacterium sp.]|uniref:hypothetical protein n=1 Tax=Phenylobacterium sp. TaxID=1871053 RepID=UPI00286BA398|nr:hypothetical protein [Phenylobacterium sp.]
MSQAANATRPFYWSVRRELWESRSILVAPLATTGLVLLGFLVSTIGLPGRRLETLTLDPLHQLKVIGEPYVVSGVILTGVMMIVALFYCLGALFDERRDRSILFWKSLPVSDLTTVLSKAAIPMAVMPALTLAAIVGAQAIILLVSTLILAGAGVSTAIPWSLGDIVGEGVALAYGLVTLSLWLAPVYGWLLLVSAWARRAPFLWAVLPPLALCAGEHLAFRSNLFTAALIDRLTGADAHAFVGAWPLSGQGPAGLPPLGLARIDPLRFLGSPGLWVGLLIAAACLAGCVWLRRRREPI